MQTIIYVLSSLFPHSKNCGNKELFAQLKKRTDAAQNHPLQNEDFNSGFLNESYFFTHHYSLRRIKDTFRSKSASFGSIQRFFHIEKKKWPTSVEVFL